MIFLWSNCFVCEFLYFMTFFNCFAASATFFDRDLFFPNFLTRVPVNKTIPLFGPRAWRVDDYDDPANWLREPTNDTVRGVVRTCSYTLQFGDCVIWFIL